MQETRSARPPFFWLASSHVRPSLGGHTIDAIPVRRRRHSGIGRTTPEIELARGIVGDGVQGLLKTAHGGCPVLGSVGLEPGGELTHHFC